MDKTTILVWIVTIAVIILALWVINYQLSVHCIEFDIVKEECILAR